MAAQTAVNKAREGFRQYVAGLLESTSLVVVLLLATLLGAYLALWTPIGDSGYWTNVASAPPFALLVLLIGELPLRLRASFARARAHQETIRRSASAIRDLANMVAYMQGRPGTDEPAYTLQVQLAFREYAMELGSAVRQLELETVAPIRGDALDEHLRIFARTGADWFNFHAHRSQHALQDDPTRLEDENRKLFMALDRLLKEVKAQLPEWARPE